MNRVERSRIVETVEGREERAENSLLVVRRCQNPEMYAGVSIGFRPPALVRRGEHGSE
jgi:hypothetical protein